MRPASEVVDDTIIYSTQKTSHAVAGERNCLLAAARRHFVQFCALLAETHDSDERLVESWYSGEQDKVVDGLRGTLQSIVKSLPHASAHEAVVESTLRHWQRYRAFWTEQRGSVVDGCRRIEYSPLCCGATDGIPRVPFSVLYGVHTTLTRALLDSFSSDTSVRLTVECPGCGERAAIAHKHVCLGCGDACFCSAACATRMYLAPPGVGTPVDTDGRLPAPAVCCSERCAGMQHRARAMVLHWMSTPHWPLVRSVCPRRGGGSLALPVHVDVALRMVGELPSTLMMGLTEDDAELCVFTPWIVRRWIAVAERLSVVCASAGCGEPDWMRGRRSERQRRRTRQ